MSSFKPAPADIKAFYEAYRAMGGNPDAAAFGKHLQAFFDLTFDAYIHGDGSRKDAWAQWVKHIGSEAEARRYFIAIDSVHPYT